MNIRQQPSVDARRKAVENETKTSLEHIGSYSLDASVASLRNCENMIGVTQIPMGIAGPLHGKYIPLATTEGALVASVSRGCKVITESGGAKIASHRVGATRGPVFKVNNITEGTRLCDFVASHKEQFNAIAKTTSSHLVLSNVETASVGLYRFVRFAFDTQDAMGMNMVTIATKQIVDYIEKETGCVCTSLAGNFDVDKKPSWLNVVSGRGWQVWAEVVIPRRVIATTLKTTAQGMYDVWLSKCMIGSAMAGAMAFNAQFANVVAALFLATGQDAGHIGEASAGITTCEVRSQDLYMSVYMPDVMVGTVGGGTALATQKEALSILGVQHSQEFAEIIAAAVLAGEISLLASLSEGTLAKAHKTLARGKVLSAKY